MKIPNLRELNLFKGEPLTDRDWLHNFKKILEWIGSGLYDLTIGNLIANGNVTIEGDLTVHGSTNIPGGGGGGSGGGGGNGGLTQELQNVINGQNGMSKVPQVNGFNDDFMSNEANVMFTLASNYSVGDGSITLTFVQPDSLDAFKQKHTYPFMIQVWDDTNKSYAVLTGDDGSTTGINVFTLANPLTNLNGVQVSYSTSGTVCQTWMLIPSSGIGSVSSFTGQAANLVENLYTTYIPNTIVDGTLSLGSFFNPTNTYRITSNTINTIVVSSQTDDSAMFPVMQLVGNPATPTVIMAYNSLNNEFIQFTLSANTMYNSTNQLLTFTVNEDTTNLDTVSWFIFKPLIMSAAVMNTTEQVTPSVLLPSAIVAALSSKIFEERFNYPVVTSAAITPTLFAGNWKGWVYGYANNTQNFGISSNNELFIVVNNASTGQLNYATVFREGIVFPPRGRMKMNISNSYITQQTSAWRIGVGANAEFDKTTGFSICGQTTQGVSQTLYILRNNAIVAEISYNYWGDFTVEIEWTPSRLAFYFYQANTQKPLTPTLSYNGEIFSPTSLLSFSLFKTGGYSTSFYVNDISMYDDSKNCILYSLLAQTGNKITIASALPIADTVNETLSISGVAGYLA